MENPKLRKLLVLFHLFAAGFMAPAFLLVAVTGGAYLLGQKGQETKVALKLPASTATVSYTHLTLPTIHLV